MADANSNSDFSGSSASNTTMSSVDNQIMQLGEEKVVKIVSVEMTNAVFTYILYPLAQLMEFGLLTRYFGDKVIYDYFIFQVILQIGNFFITSVAKAGAQIAQKAIAKNQVIIANTFYVHTVAIQFLLLIPYLIIGAVLKIGTSGVQGNYLIIRIIGGGLCDILGRQMHEFYKIENRNFLMFCQEAVATSMYIGLMVLLLENDLLMQRSMDAAAIAYVIAHGIVFVWGLFAIHHAPFLDADYRGCLKFSFKRLSPIRPKFIVQILIKAVPVFLYDSPHSLAYGLALIFIARFKIPAREKAELYFLVGYYLMSLLHKAISKAIYDTMILVGNYNVQIKKITRVFETLKIGVAIGVAYQVLVMIILGVVNLPFANTGMKLKHFLFNRLFDNPSYVLQLIQDELDTVLFISSLVNVSQCFANPVFAMLNLEDNALLPVVISGSMILFTSLILFALTQLLGEAPHFYYGLVFFEAFDIAAAIPFLWFYYDKYLRLYKLNIQAAAVAEKIGTVKEGKQEDQTVRDSVMMQMSAAEDENEKQRLQKSKITNVFDKNRALKQSGMFVNMRDSIRDSVAQSARGSTMMLKRDSSVRVSQNLRDSSNVRHSDAFEHIQK